MPLLFAFLALATNSPVLSVPIAPDYSTTTLSEYVKSKHIPKLWETLNCESGFKYDSLGDKGTSFGIAQIHLPAHLNITKEQALDPYWAINWSVEQFKKGNARIWSCYAASL